MQGGARVVFAAVVLVVVVFNDVFFWYSLQSLVVTVTVVVSGRFSLKGRMELRVLGLVKVRLISHTVKRMEGGTV